MQGGGDVRSTPLRIGLLVMININRRQFSGLTTPWFFALVLGIWGMTHQASASFTDVSATALPLPTMGNGQPPELDGGAATGAFAGDGAIDIFFPTRNDRDLFFRNNGDGTFTEIGEQVGLTFATDARSAAAGDIDNDGDLDIYVLAHLEADHYLYINDGSGFFTEEAALRGAEIGGGLRLGASRIGPLETEAGRRVDSGNRRHAHDGSRAAILR